MAVAKRRPSSAEHTDLHRSKALEIFTCFLRQRGLSDTAGRRAIVDCIYGMEGHFDIYELDQRLRELGFAHRATLYRTLKLLMEAGLIAKVRTDSHSRVAYEHTLGHSHHDHLVCDRCGEIVEFHDHGIESLQDGIASRYGFKLLHHNLTLTGICPSCQQTSRRYKRTPSRVVHHAVEAP